MRIVTRGLFLFLVMFSLVSCKQLLKSDDMLLPAHIAVGGSYYTQFVIRYEKGVHVTTNYRRGASIPVNTSVKLLDINSKSIEVEVAKSSQKLTVKNIEKHTGDDINRMFDKMFAKKKVDLSKFTDLERSNIENGSVAEGMSKDAVIVAIGYPPITETMNLDSNLWVYWSGRFNKFNVHFKNGKVTKVED